MLPYTTYHIPESENHQTGLADKWLCMVVPAPDSPDQKELLQKISAALKADLETEVLFISYVTGQDISLSDLPSNQIKLIISFGPTPEQLGIWIDLQKPGMRVLEKYSFILTSTPDALANNAIAKKELWRSMQTFLELQSS